VYIYIYMPLQMYFCLCENMTTIQCAEVTYCIIVSVELMELYLV